MNQLLGYTLVFIGFVLILLITIRNRYMPLIGCALALFGVEGFLFITMRHQLSQSLWIYILGILFIDALILFALWQFFFGFQNPERDGIQTLVGNKKGPFSLLVGWLMYASSLIEKMITTKWFRLLLSLLFIFWCLTSCVRSCRTFPDG
jgi:hypothetical protein